MHWQDRCTHPVGLLFVLDIWFVGVIICIVEALIEDRFELPGRALISAVLTYSFNCAVVDGPPLRSATVFRISTSSRMHEENELHMASVPPLTLIISNEVTDSFHSFPTT